MMSVIRSPMLKGLLPCRELIFQFSPASARRAGQPWILTLAECLPFTKWLLGADVRQRSQWVGGGLLTLSK